MAFITWTDPLLSELNLQSSDQTRATALINVACAAMDQYTNRRLENASFDKTFIIKLDGTIHVDAYPITSLNRVLSQKIAIMSFTCTAPISTIATTDTGVNLYTIVSGVPNTVTLTYATYPTLSQLTTAINAQSGWTATLENSANLGSMPSGDLVSGQSLSGSSGSSLYMFQDSGNLYQCDTRLGMLHVFIGNTWLATGNYLGYGGNFSDGQPMGWQWGADVSPNSLYSDMFRRCRVVWSGGYVSTDPEYPTLQRICAELVKNLWGSTYGLEDSQSIGYESLSLKDVNLNRVPITTRKMLDYFRNRSL